MRKGKGSLVLIGIATSLLCFLIGALYVHFQPASDTNRAKDLGISQATYRRAKKLGWSEEEMQRVKRLGGLVELPLVYAIKDIPAGTRVTRDMLGTVPLAECFIPQGAVSRISDVEGRIARFNIVPNELFATHYVVGLATGTKADPDLEHDLRKAKPKSPTIDSPKFSKTDSSGVK